MKLKNRIFNLLNITLIVINAKHTKLYTIPRFFGKIKVKKIEKESFKKREYKTIIIDEVGYYKNECYKKVKM